MVTKRQADRFEEVLRRGRYLFHIHTNWTDGKSALSEYCLVARKLGFRSIILAEHIRRECSYDFGAFLDLIEEQQLSYGLEIVAGVEAKILPNGFLDIPESALTKIQVVAVAEHSFQGDAYLLADSLVQAFRSLIGTKLACVWVHPGLRLFRDPAGKSLFSKVLQSALENSVYIEFNLRYKLPPSSLRALIPASRTIIGTDAHSVEDVEKLAARVFREESKLIHGDRGKK